VDHTNCLQVVFKTHSFKKVVTFFQVFKYWSQRSCQGAEGVVRPHINLGQARMPGPTRRSSVDGMGKSLMKVEESRRTHTFHCH
jgi:hypothetical protein